MKHVKDRIKDGLMLIMVMVGVMIASMTLTACSEDEGNGNEQNNWCIVGEQFDTINQNVTGVARLDAGLEMVVIDVRADEWNGVSEITSKTASTYSLVPRPANSYDKYTVGDTVSVFIPMARRHGIMESNGVFYVSVPITEINQK